MKVYLSQYLTNFMHKIFVLQYIYFLPLHVSSTCAHHQDVKIALHSLRYHHTETSEWSKITKIKFYKYEQIVVKFMCELYNQSFHHNNELIPEQHLNEHNPMFDLLHSNTTHVITHLKPNPQSHAFQTVLSQPVHEKATYRVSTF